MKHRLSFGYFTLLAENIVEVIIDEGIENTKKFSFEDSEIENIFDLIEKEYPEL